MVERSPVKRIVVGSIPTFPFRILDMKLKAKKIKVWCKEKPTHLAGCPGAGWTLGKRVGNKVINRLRGVDKLPNKVVCPDCKNKFKPRVRECHDLGCWHVYLPAHKKLVKVK